MNVQLGRSSCSASLSKRREPLSRTTLSASQQVSYNLATGEITMRSPVRISQPGTEVTGDRPTANVRRRCLIGVGHVVVRDNVRPSRGRRSTLTTDRLVIEGMARRFTATGRVRYTESYRRAVANNGVLDRRVQILTLTGDAVLSGGVTRVRARIVRYDLVTSDVRASGEPVTVHRLTPQANHGC